MHLYVCLCVCVCVLVTSSVFQFLQFGMKFSTLQRNTSFFRSVLGAQSFFVFCLLEQISHFFVYNHPILDYFNFNDVYLIGRSDNR